MKQARPKSIWVIYDPLDGPHLFRSKREAWRTYNAWHKEAEEDGIYDSFWDMSEPTEYTRKVNKQ
jgi:hypothetical protein